MRLTHLFPVISIGLLLLATACGNQRLVTSSGLQPKAFQQKAEGQKTRLYKITNSKGMEACITNYGARVVSLMVPDKNGKLEDVVCGFSNIEDYISQSQNYGATVGRYIGRILNAQYTLDGKTYHLQYQPLVRTYRSWRKSQLRGTDVEGYAKHSFFHHPELPFTRWREWISRQSEPLCHVYHNRRQCLGYTLRSNDRQANRTQPVQPLLFLIYRAT